MKQNCSSCGNPLMCRLLERYDDNTLGLEPVALLGSVNELVCRNCPEERYLHIPGDSNLHCAIAVWLATSAARLKGEQVRFVRTVLELPAKRLARLLEVTPETLSRWENDKEAMSAAAEKLLRLIVCGRLAAKARTIPVDFRAMTETGIKELLPPGKCPVPPFRAHPVHGWEQPGWSPVENWVEEEARARQSA